MIRIKTQYNYESQIGEINILPSCTQRDKSLSIKEIVQRFVVTGVIPEEVAQHEAEYDTYDVENFDVPESSYAADIAEIWNDYEEEQSLKQAVKASRSKRSDRSASDNSPAGVTASEQSSENNDVKTVSKTEE